MSKSYKRIVRKRLELALKLRVRPAAADEELRPRIDELTQMPSDVIELGDVSPEPG